MVGVRVFECLSGLIKGGILSSIHLSAHSSIQFLHLSIHSPRRHPSAHCHLSSSVIHPIILQYSPCHIRGSENTEIKPLSHSPMELTVL